ncbi:MAG: SWIM zinc finger family protein, partial [Thermomicrobiales bacterium]
MTAFPISDTLISQHATDESYARGDDYARSGRVSALSVRDNVLSASVQGSEFAPYSVRVTAHEGAVTDAACTCLYSYGGWCKHIVAALIVAARQPGEVAERPSLAGRLELLERDALQALVLRLVEHDSEIEAAVERLLPAVAGDTADVAALVSV